MLHVILIPMNWKVPSETINNKFYEITKVGDRFVCSCLDCLYREHDCKHILKLKARLEEEDKMDEEFIKEEHKRILKEKRRFIPLEEI